MEIKNLLNPLDAYKTKLGQSENANKAAARQPGQNSAGTTALKGDTVNLSSESRLRTEALTTATRTPEIRQAKVDALKAKVGSGEYTPDSRQIASRLLTEEPGLFRAGR